MVTQQVLKGGSTSPSTEMEAGTAGSLHCLFPRVRELGFMTTQNKDDILSPPSLLGSNLLLSSSKGDMHEVLRSASGLHSDGAEFHSLVSALMCEASLVLRLDPTVKGTAF